MEACETCSLALEKPMPGTKVKCNVVKTFARGEWILFCRARVLCA
jgi:hypothetical protein